MFLVLDRSIVTNDLVRRMKAQGFARYCCLRDEPQRLKPEIIMSTLVKQLASKTSSGPFHKAVIGEYEERKKLSPGVTRKLDFKDSYELAKTICDSYAQSLIFIDGLDELDQASSSQLLGALHKLATQSSSLVKIFITSRPDRDIVTTLTGIPTMVIDLASCKEHGNDMQLIVEERVTKVMEKLFNAAAFPEFRSQITEIVLKRAREIRM